MDTEDKGKWEPWRYEYRCVKCDSNLWEHLHELNIGFPCSKCGIVQGGISDAHRANIYRRTVRDKVEWRHPFDGFTLEQEMAMFRGNPTLYMMRKGAPSYRVVLETEVKGGK